MTTSVPPGKKSVILHEDTGEIRGFGSVDPVYNESYTIDNIVDDSKQYTYWSTSQFDILVTDGVFMKSLSSSISGSGGSWDNQLVLFEKDIEVSSITNHSTYNKPITINYTNGYKITIEYNANRKPTLIRYYNSGNSLVESYTYNYDSDGYIESSIRN